MEQVHECAPIIAIYMNAPYEKIVNEADMISSVQLTLRRCPDTGIEKAATVTEKGKTP